jgi:alanyl-tRNA synthetase
VLPEKCASAASEIKEKDKKIESLTQQIANAKVAAIFDGAEDVNGVKVVSAMMTGVTPDALRKLGDGAKDKADPVIALFAGIDGDKGTFYCVCNAGAVEKGAHAGKIVQRIAAITGGKGGGRPDSAMAGVGKTYMVDEALMSFESIVKEFIS